MSDAITIDSWSIAKLGDLAEQITKGTTPTTAGFSFQLKGVPFVKIENINSNGVDLNSVSQFISKEAHEALQRSQLESGDILFSIAGTIGKTALISSKHIPCNTNQAVAIIRGTTKAFDPGFLRYQLKSSAQRIMDKNARGGAMNNISLGDLKEIKLSLAPLPEQKRIADKLDTVLARVDACRERLNRVPLILKRFRQSVLAAATTGKLTEDWRQSKDKWNYCKAEELCEWITKGTTPPKSNMYEGRGDVPYIKVYNLCFDGKLDFTVNPTFVDKDTHEVMLKRSKVFPGDVLMNIVGPPLGKVSIVPDSFPEWNINQAIAVFRAKQEINNRFLAYFLMCETTITGLIRKSKATAGQFNLTLEICRQIDVPLPSIEEQHEIVRRVETLFAFADRLEARLATARAATERLTPALLAKAFRGELVPQDPDDEPAAALLQRLAASRAESGSKPRRARAAKV